MTIVFYYLLINPIVNNKIFGQNWLVYRIVRKNVKQIAYKI